MTTKNLKKKPIVLLAVWGISGLALTLFNKYNQLFGIASIQDTTSLLITVLAIALYFIPLLIVIYHQANAVSLKWLVVVSRILIFYLSIMLLLLLIVLLCQLFRTGQGDGSVVPLS